MKLFAFEIAGEMMGFEAGYVYRVLEGLRVTPVCFTPSGYMGLVYHRGEIFDVVDLAGLLEAHEPDAADKKRFVIVRWSNRKMAIAVGTIAGLLWLQGDEEDDTCYTEDGRPVRILAPDWIWNKLTGQFYGPVQV
ncbi:MAG: chemotaxis protein CheW [Desulfobacterales bacterium]|nr:chemotaxis protein CheW [Desulfobacterales bacterium]